ncbi:MAG: SufB/SufD family protein [Coriobacteriales bacterium]|jgi:Fe-S cluster assembly protein SufD
MNEKTRLEHVNTVAAQTWNYLKINEISLEVPTPEMMVASATKNETPYVTEFAASPVSFDTVGKLPDDMKEIETGVGEETVEWIERSAAITSLIDVPAGCRPKKPIVVDLTSEVSVAVNTGIRLREGSMADIVAIASSDNEDESISANLLRIVVEKDAHANLFEIISMPPSKTHIEGVGIDVKDGASVDIDQYSLGAGCSVVGLAANLSGEKSSLNLKMHYLGKGSETIDINHLVRMSGKDTRAKIDESGVLADECRKSLRATIDLIRGGKGAKGREQETVVVTGDDVVNKTLPVILCDEEDVQGDHGATIGSMSEEQLQYLRDRGLSMEQAEELFQRAITEAAVIHSPTPRSRAVALDAVAKNFGQDVADDLDNTIQPTWYWDQTVPERL